MVQGQGETSFRDVSNSATIITIALELMIRPLVILCFFMKTFIFIFLLVAQQALFGQTPLPAFTAAQKDTMTFMQDLPVKADFMLVYSRESYWWSNQESYKLLVRSDNNWTAWTYFREWDNGAARYGDDIRKLPEYFTKRASLNSASVRELFDSLSTVNFWTLISDSLSETNGYSISDAVDYIFRLEYPNQAQILESYAPEYYFEKFPGMRHRFLFVQGKNIFERWWKRYASGAK